jgi:hypothetical protein
MLAINDLNVSLDLDKAALAAVTGAGTHYRFISRRTSTSRWSGWKLRSNRLVSSNVRKHGVRHNKYIQRFTRSRNQVQTQYQAKYVG